MHTLVSHISIMRQSHGMQKQHSTTHLGEHKAEADAAARLETRVELRQQSTHARRARQRCRAVSADVDIDG